MESTRTTLSLSAENAANLRKLARESGQTFKDVVNLVIRAGLTHLGDQRAVPYTAASVALGKPFLLRDSIDPAQLWDDAELSEKMAERK